MTDRKSLFLDADPGPEVLYAMDDAQVAESLIDASIT